MRKQAHIVRTSVLCSQPGRYIGWPTIARAANGDILVVFSGDRDGHICMEGKTQMIRSLDEGETWTAPATINDTPMDDRDAGLLALSDGSLVLSWFTSYHHPDDPRRTGVKEEVRESWRKRAENITDTGKARWLSAREGEYAWTSGRWIRRSLDHGFTWEPPVKVSVSSPHGPTELADGSMLFIGTSGEGNKIIAVEKSLDRGKTWTIEFSMDACVDREYGRLTEPHALETREGLIIGMFRYERDAPGPPPAAMRDYCCLWQAQSTDGGKTWNKPYETEIWGKPPHLIKLKDGRILVAYGHRREPYGERACFSYDGGKTWDYKNEIILSETESGDLGYPSSLDLDDGTIATVYYEKDNPDEKPCLKATFWKFPR